MQSIGNLGSSVFRVVFRRGSLQRVHYSTNRLVFALLLMLAFLIAAQLWYFRSDALDTGLAAFVGTTSLLIASSWLTWKVPRKRLMTALLVVLLITAAAFLLLTVASVFPVWDQAALRYTFAGALALAVILGASNCLQYALGSSRTKAFTWTIAFALVVLLLYSTLRGLLAVVFAS